ncbi:MAG: hypothetical protein JKY57_04940 [Kordiimonadaceae bacterium]|nr:hypothetical protein [Kordiimonadaceae bacterium]
MRKFYTDVSVVTAEAGFQVTLDGRIVKTPSKAALLLPTYALAEAMAVEWRAQGDKVDTNSMPINRLANTALDRVGPRFDLVAKEIAAFGGTDLLCYRTDEPAALVEREHEMWNPFLKWAENALDAPLKTTNGVMPIVQDVKAIASLTEAVNAYGVFELTALHEFTNGFGSLVLALAFMKGEYSFDDCLQASLLHQTHQEEKWGEDSEVTDKTALLLIDLTAVCEFISHLRNKTADKPS